jgi:hypothetical protein
MKQSLLILFIALCALALYFLSQKNWSLMVCSSLLDNGIDCKSNAYVKKNQYFTLEKCLAAGREEGKIGFECGNGCKNVGALVCKELCNSRGTCVK